MEIQNSIFNYATLLKQVKARVALAQKKAIYSANEEMLFYVLGYRQTSL